MAPDDFLDDENWLGSYYELAIQLGPRDEPGADQRLLAALHAIDDHPTLEGWYLDRRTPPADQDRVKAVDVPLDGTQVVHGWAMLTSGQRIVCLATVIREDFGDRYDWLDVCLPSGAFSHFEPRSRYLVPGDEANQSWREPVDTWFTDIAERVARATTFRLALIGEEVSGSPEADLFTGTAPDERYISFIVPVGDGVMRFPTNRW